MFLVYEIFLKVNYRSTHLHNRAVQVKVVSGTSKQKSKHRKYSESTQMICEKYCSLGYDFTFGIFKDNLFSPLVKKISYSSEIGYF